MAGATNEKAEKLEQVEVNADDEDVDVVDPWNVKTTSEKGIDYEKLISKFKWSFG